MAKLIVVLLVGLCFEAVGVVFLSRGLKEIGAPAAMSTGEVLALIRRGMTNPSLLLGVVMEAVFFGTLLYLMSQGDVSFVWPLTALGFVLTTLVARFVLHETVTPLRWAGVALIMLGAGMITWTEHTKAPRASGAVPTEAALKPR